MPADTTKVFKCWIEGERPQNPTEVEAYDSEQAAEQYGDLYLDYEDFMNGGTVYIEDVGGVVRKFHLEAEASINWNAWPEE